MAVRAQQAEVGQSIVVVDAVDVIKDQHERLVVPPGTQAAYRTDVPQTASAEKPKFQAVAVGVSAGNKHRVE